MDWRWQLISSKVCEQKIYNNNKKVRKVKKKSDLEIFVTRYKKSRKRLKNVPYRLVI